MAQDRSARVIIELLRSGQAVRFRARGRSMWPTIPSRSLVEVVPCAPSELEVGQIAAFERSGQVVVHRVREVGADGVFFSGDSREQHDGCVTFAQVLGKARVVRRRRLQIRVPTLWHLNASWRAVSRRAKASWRAFWRRLG